MLKCPFCNFETTWPAHGKVYECDGECYTTYAIVKPSDDIMRVKMRLIEVFFLDGEYNLRITPQEVDQYVEFTEIDAQNPGDKIMFARENRPSVEEIEKLQNASLDEIMVGLDLMERIDLSLDRFKRDLKHKAQPDKLLSDIKVVESLVSILRQKLELSQ